MLVLRRRVGEVVAIGPNIEVEVVDISPTRVKLGIRAPRDICVNRRDASTIANENRQASSLISMQGSEGVSGMLALLHNFSSNTP